MDDIPRCVLPYPMNLTYPPPTMRFHQLPKTLQFLTPLGHRVQAIEAHTRGNWAAANSQLRTFLESPFDDIARKVSPTEAAQRPTSENRRALLAQIGFLAADRN
jgi:hypothetical protein